MYIYIYHYYHIYIDICNGKWSAGAGGDSARGGQRAGRIPPLLLYRLPQRRRQQWGLITHNVLIKCFLEVKSLTKSSTYYLLLLIKTTSWRFCGGLDILKPYLRFYYTDFLNNDANNEVLWFHPQREAAGARVLPLLCQHTCTFNARIGVPRS